MTEESESPKDRPKASGQVRKVLSYRVFVGYLCQAVLELSKTGDIFTRLYEKIEEGSRGAK